jgi:hypothetical protein
MFRFALGFFVAALIFAPVQTVDFVSSATVIAKSAAERVMANGLELAAETEQQIIKREIEKKLKLEE